MALYMDCKCKKCGETKSENVNVFNGVCTDCQTKDYEEKREEYLGTIKGFSVSQRLELMEKQLYDIKHMPKPEPTW